MGRRLRRGLSEALVSPFAWVLVAFGVLGVVGLSWGMPASDGWDNDGVSPRDFLPGLAETFTPGHYYTYPPVQLVILALATAPVTVVALARAPSLRPPDLIQQFIQVPTMTGIAMISRAVTLAMAVTVVWAIGKIAEEIAGRRARTAAAACAAVNASLVYYAHTTNLDVPYLFFGTLMLLALVRALCRREPRRLRSAALLGVLAVGTKDQAYALFLAALPVAVVLYFTFDGWARKNARRIAREAAIATGMAALLFLVTDAVIFNPTGFRARVGFLLGPASQDFVHYTNDWTGRSLVVLDIAKNFTRYYPMPFAVVGALGVAAAARLAFRGEGASGDAVPAPAEGPSGGAGRVVGALLPLLFALSFTACFNCIARRTDHRFALPQHVFFAVYVGVAVASAWSIRARLPRLLARGALALAFARALFDAVSIDAALVLDPRYEAEAWLEEHARAGDVVETYALNVYLPRFPAKTKVVRVGPGPADKRNPLPAVTEVQDAYGNVAARRPRFIVVSQGWVWRYLLDPEQHMEPGRVLPPTQKSTGAEADGSSFFRGLVAGQRGYREAYKARWTSKIFPRLDLHASTGQEVWIYERVDP
ncbi:MAG: glycosyltransferase family 39 protein [Myxococcales bacterium]|nr:glycosyltransferase family 39 protein [Myxococcales bacterium]